MLPKYDVLLMYLVSFWQEWLRLDDQVLDCLNHRIRELIMTHLVVRHEALHFLNSQRVEEQSDELKYQDHECLRRISFRREDISKSASGQSGRDEVDGNDVLLSVVIFSNTSLTHPSAFIIIPLLTKHDLHARKEVQVYQS